MNNKQLIVSALKTSNAWGDSLTSQNFQGVESPFLNLIFPVFKFINWINICPDSFYFDKSQHLVFSKGSTLRKVFSGLIQLLVILYVIGFATVLDQQLNGYFKLMTRLVTVGYVTFSLTWYRAVFSKCADIFKVLQSIQNFEQTFLVPHSKIPNSSKYKMMAWLTLFLHFWVAIAYTLINRLKIENLLDQGLESFIQHLTSLTCLELNLLFKLNIRYNASQSLEPLNVAIATPLIIVSFLFDFFWVMAFAMTFLWGILFSKLFSTFFSVISTTKGDLLHDLRKFNALTFILDQFNQVYSPTMLSAVIAGCLHFSVYILTLLMPSDSKGLVPFITASSFIIFWGQLFSSAHVNHSAQQMATLLKSRFQSETEWAAENRGTVKSMELTQGLLIISNDLTGGNIGFQGLGFFTISYSFIGTIVSVIATYSVVALQFTLPSPQTQQNS